MNIRNALCLATLAAASMRTLAGSAVPALASPADRNANREPVLNGPEASIPFINHGGIYDFHVENDQGIWVQAASRKWYYGKFFSPCIGIESAIQLGFQGGPTDTLDRFGTVVSRGAGRCKLTSLRASTPPPGWMDPKDRSNARAKDAAKDAESAKDADASKVNAAP